MIGQQIGQQNGTYSVSLNKTLGDLTFVYTLKLKMNGLN